MKAFISTWSKTDWKPC